MDHLYHHQLLVLRQLCDMLSKMPSCLFFGDKNTGKKKILAQLSKNYDVCVMIDDHQESCKIFGDYHVYLSDPNLTTLVNSIVERHQNENILWIVNHYNRYIFEYFYMDDNEIGCTKTCAKIIEFSMYVRQQRTKDRVVFHESRKSQNERSKCACHVNIIRIIKWIYTRIRRGKFM